MSQSPQLSPPGFTFFNELKNSIGNDPLVTVGNMIQLSNGANLIPVLVKKEDKAQALATILDLHKDFGGTMVDIQVIFDGQVVQPLDEDFTPRQLVKLFEAALSTNRFFKFAVFRQIFPGTFGVFPVFSKRVIQFFNDDLSDLYQNFNGVAAAVFRDVLRGSINDIVINPSTKDSNENESDSDRDRDRDRDSNRDRGRNRK